jgi:hypothetical protein
MITTESLIITMDDCRKAGHCASGVRRWFTDQQIDFREFMRAGIPAATLLATGDALGQQVVARTIKRRVLADDGMSEQQAITMLEGGIDG